LIPWRLSLRTVSASARTGKRDSVTCSTRNTPKSKELEKADTADNEYTVAKTEEALKRACGRHYVPREQRYDFSMRTPDGREVKL